MSSDPPSNSSVLPNDPSSITSYPAPSPANPASTHTMVTRSQTGHLQPKQFPGFQSFHTKYPMVTYLSITPEIEPSNYRTASPNPRWQAAMKAEFEALLSNGTWSLCPRPHNQHVIHNKWVYKIKRKADGSVERFKDRLVAKGFEQQSGIDFTETFSPVIKPSTIRLILALAVFRNWPIRQLDISNAFLHGNLAEEVYMEQPLGFIDQQHPAYVCKLHKAIYGLKEAPRA